MATTIYRAVSDYLTDMISAIAQSGAAITDFSQGSGTRSLFEAVGASLSLQSLIADQLRADMFLATATGQALDDKAADFQVTRVAAVQATGTIRVTQALPGSTIFIPAGFGQLSTAAVGSSNPAVAVVTTSDATLQAGAAYVDIPAQAVLGGTAGNLAGGTQLTPGTPINGIVSATGFQVTPGAAFTNGVNAETDDVFRARIPIAVQGRVNGTKAAMLAAALATPGVSGAAVVPAGSYDGAQTVPAGTVEVFYAGTAGLAAVTSACLAAGVMNQNIAVAAATADRCVCNCAITALKGTDPVALAAAALAAAQAVFGAVAPGGTAYYSTAIQAIHLVPGVITVNVPLTDFRRFSEAPGTVHDIVENPNTYPSLASADFSAAVTLI